MCATDKNLNFSKKCIQDYEVISVLGSGSFGTCYKVRDKKWDKLFAWKSIDYDEFDEAKLASLVAEIGVLRQLQHPNIVRYYHHLNSHAAKSIFIIMEWCENGDLSHLISKARIERQRFDEKYIWRVLFQICKALQICHTKFQQGTVLHRDIKPANIFLDAQWNAKLGDFGLARLVQRNECFAKSFVGTPYYMSPEIIKNTRYDCKSDVWALGCLIYEMAALHRPFNGRKIQQLSNNIINGKYANISSVYSEELQNMISFMLEIDETARPGVEVIVRHPNVVKNNDLDNRLQPLVEAEDIFKASPQHGAPTTRQQLEYSFSSLDDSCRDLGRRLSVSGVFTPDLRKEIFYSANRKLQRSDSELYKTARHCDSNNEDKINRVPDQQPQHVSQKVFHEQLKERLHAIRAQEALLKRKEEDLAAFELKLNAKESKLRELEQKLDKKQIALEEKIKNFKQINRRRSNSLALIERKANVQTTNKHRASLALSLEQKIDGHDEIYCTIEPQDELSPTVAKLNLKNLQQPHKSLTTFRKVTFQSPKRPLSIEQENKPPKLRNVSMNKMRNSICSSSDGSNSDSTNQRRRSLLSLLGIKRSNKDTSVLNELPTQVAASQLKQLPNPPTDILSKCQTEKLTNVWTKENKRAAFDLLAVMNANQADDAKVGMDSTKLRQSLRDSTRSALRRERMRQSMRVFPLALEMK